MRNHYEEFQNDLKEFRDMTGKFYRKEISVAEYKSFSGGFGSYAQRGGERSMLRLRLPGGEIDHTWLKFIAQSIEKYRIDKVHLTTCQTVQLHNLTDKTVCDLIEEAWQNGIITRGGGGDYPRNVMCSPLSGTDKDECFDVLPYAKEAGDYLLGFIKTVKLPRKLKVAFSNGNDSSVHATFRDLGFVANENGCFDVYCAGGLGIKPKFGVKVVENLEPKKVLYAVKTMIDVFTTYGNYEKRALSRSRFIQDSLGVEGLQSVFMEMLKKNLESECLDLEISREDRRDKDNAGEIVPYFPVGGCVPPDFFKKLYQAAEDMCCADRVKIRLTPTQGMYIINLTAAEAEKIRTLTAGGAQNAFEASTACIGADICQVGIGKSQNLLEACVGAVRAAGIEGNVLPQIHISGCPSSCAAHQTAKIGLRGGMKQTPDGPKHAFAVFDNGSEQMGAERMGEELGVMTVEDIPKFFVALGREVADMGLTYDAFYEQYPNRVKEIAHKYI